MPNKDLKRTESRSPPSATIVRPSSKTSPSGTKSSFRFWVIPIPDHSSFGVLNAEATGKEKGMAHPGFFFIDSGGVIREKYFETKYVNRFTPNNVIGRLFPELTEEVSESVEAPHLGLTLEQSDREVAPGSRVSLIADIQLPPDVHVYSPGVQGTSRFSSSCSENSGIELAPATYPASKDLYLEAIQEHVPVYAGKFRIIQDVTINFSAAADGVRSLISSEKKVTVKES